MNSGKHEQEGDSPDTLHCEFGPQGDGSQGFVGTTTAVSSKKICNVVSVRLYCCGFKTHELFDIL